MMGEKGQKAVRQTVMRSWQKMYFAKSGEVDGEIIIAENLYRTTLLFKNYRHSTTACPPPMYYVGGEPFI
jgi:hypothetical protein